jgi:serine/threonine protein kinase
VASSNIRVSQQPEGPGFLKVYETMPYYESGELWNVIFKGQNPNVRLTPAEKTTREQFKLHRWGIAKDVLTGLAQIHQSGIVHRDLKPENVFLYQDQGRVRATVGDLGLVCERDVPTLPQGTPCYQAPELAPCMMNPKQPIPYALASDVWAAGIILYAIFAEREPDYFDFEYRDLVETLKDDGFSDRLQRNIIPNILSSEQRLGVSTDTIKSLNQLILKMLHGDPEKRPTAEAVLKEYEEIMPKPTNVITEKGGV